MKKLSLALAFALDPERAHRLTIRALRARRAGRPPAPDPVLATRVAGLNFPNPVGLAAGLPLVPNDPGKAGSNERRAHSNVPCARETDV